MKSCKPNAVGALIASLVTLSGCWCGPGWWGDGHRRRGGDDLVQPGLVQPAGRPQAAPNPSGTPERGSRAP